MRLIDADALKEMLIKERDEIPLTKTERYGFGVEFQNPHGMSMRGGINKAFRCMEQTPTIDAVPVVRCAECKWFDKGGNGVAPICARHSGLAGAHDRSFCSYGERRSDE